MSLTWGDEAPHIFTRKSHRRPAEFPTFSAKRLLQQYQPFAAAALVNLRGRYRGHSCRRLTHPARVRREVADIEHRSQQRGAGRMLVPLALLMG